MKHFLEELCIAARRGFRRPREWARACSCGALCQTLRQGRFGTGIAMQGCKNMSLADGVRIGRGCSSMPRAGRWTWARTRP